MRVLVLREAADAQATIAALKDAGHEALSSPVLSLRFIRPPAISSDDWSGIVVTSRHGIEALARRPDIEAWRTKSVFCVGAATAAAARRSGFSAVHAARGDVTDLVSLVAARRVAGKLLYASGEAVSCDLPRALADHGIEAERDVVYAMDLVPEPNKVARDALESGTVDGAMFMSSRTVSGFATQLDNTGLTAVATSLFAWCLSGAIGTTARDAGFARVVVAPEKTEQSLIAAIAAAQ